ncbi:MAG: hypothetical protein A2048_10865 [Deltaproteobacteria bacterium GWA2_45_12]|nr:MAG: hypothetical protein A2048_10865 [Deltaproteobacteria bacterium GWA2_45_12]
MRPGGVNYPTTRASEHLGENHPNVFFHLLPSFFAVGLIHFEWKSLMAKGRWLEKCKYNAGNAGVEPRSW